MLGSVLRNGASQGTGTTPGQLRVAAGAPNGLQFDARHSPSAKAKKPAQRLLDSGFSGMRNLTSIIVYSSALDPPTPPALSAL